MVNFEFVGQLLYPVVKTWIKLGYKLEDRNIPHLHPRIHGLPAWKLSSDLHHNQCLPFLPGFLGRMDLNMLLKKLLQPHLDMQQLKLLMYVDRVPRRRYTEEI